MRFRLLLALSPLLYACFAPVHAADRTRKDNDRPEQPTRYERYYRDDDGDGTGAGTPVFIREGDPVAAGYVRTNNDCDDENPRIVESRPELLRDCNANAVAETTAPQAVCVGRPEVFLWEDDQGAMHAAFRYRDADGRFWIDAESARRAADGTLLQEAVPDCTER